MDHSDRQKDCRPTLPGRERGRHLLHLCRAGSLAAALSISLASGLGAQDAAPAASWIPLPQAWLDAGKVLPGEPSGGAVWTAMANGRYSVAESEACRQLIGDSAAWAAIVSGTAEGAAPELSGGRVQHDKTALEAPGGLWLKVTGGTFTSLNGGNCSDWTDTAGDHPKNLTGDACLYLTGDTVVNGHVSGGDYKMAGRPAMTGDLAVVIDGNAQVKGSIFGAGPMMHGGFPSLTGDTDIVVRNVQTNSGRIVGSFGWTRHNQSHATHTGNTRILIDVPKAEPAPETAPEFAKEIFGGTLVGTGNQDESVVTGDTTVTVKAPGVKFLRNIAGGGADASGGSITARVRGNSTVILQDGIFAGTVRAGGWTGHTAVDGTATLELQGGTYASTAKLLPGNAAQSVLRVCKETDLSGIAEIGPFGRVEFVKGRPTIASSQVHPDTVYCFSGFPMFFIKLPSESLNQTYVFPAKIEGDGKVAAGADMADSKELVNNRVRLAGNDRLWTVTDGGSWSEGWQDAKENSVSAPVGGSIVIDASKLTQDKEVTIPSGVFETVSVIGNSTAFLTLRFESSVTAGTLHLYSDARVRYMAAAGETIPFTVTGSGIFEAACAGRTELSRPITLAAPGALRISGGTLAFAKEGQNKIFVTGDVRVCAGAVLDCNGVPDACLATVTLEAGAVYANDSVTGIPVGQKQITALALEGDAFVRANAVFGMVAPGHARSYIRLNGHTLTKTGAADFICANTDCGNGTLDIREGTVRAMPNGGVSSFWDLTVRTAEGCGIAVPMKGEWAEYSGAVTLAPDAGTQMDVPLRLAGGGLLRIASGTVKLLHTGNIRWGAVRIDRGAVLDVTTPEVEVIRYDDGNNTYVGGGAGWVTVCGTLKTRFWGYNGALGGLAHETNRVLLDGGTVAFSENNIEAGSKRGFTVSAKGGTLLLPAGGKYLKQADGNASVSNAGILHLRCEGDGNPASFSFKCDVGATVDVGERVLLGGEGSVNNLRFSGTATFDTTADGFAAKRFLGNVILPRSLSVTAAAAPSAEKPLTLLTPEGDRAAVVGSAKRPVTLTVGGLVQKDPYVLTKTGTGALAVVPDTAADGFIGEVTADMTAGKASWSDVTASLADSSVTADTAAVIDLDRLGGNTFTFDNAEALTLSSLTLKGTGTVVLNGAVNVGRLWTDGTVILTKGTGKLTVTGGTDLARGAMLTAEGETALAELTLDSEATLYLGSTDITYDLQLLGEGAVIGLGLPGDTEVRDMSGLWNGVKDSNGTVRFNSPARLGTPEALQSLRLTHNQTLDLCADLTVDKLVTSDSGSADTKIIQTAGTLTVTSSDSGSNRDNCAALIAHWTRPTAYSLLRGTLSVPNGSVVLGWDGTLDMTVGKETADDASDAACFSAKCINGAARGNTATVTVKKTGILELGEGGLNLTNGTAKTVTFAGGMLRTTAGLSGNKLKINAGFKIDGSAVFCAKTDTVQQPNKLVGDADAVLTVGAPGWDGTVSLADTDLSGYAGTVKLAAGALLLNAGSENGIAVPAGSVLKLRLSEAALKQPYTAQVPDSDRARVVFVDALGTEVPSVNGVYAPVTAKTVTVAVPDEGAAWGTLMQKADLCYGDTLKLQVSAGASPTVTVDSPVRVEKLTVTGNGTLLFAGSLTVVKTLDIAQETILGLTRAMLAENVTVNNAGMIRWLEPEVTLNVGYSKDKGTVAFLGAADGNAQTLKVTGEVPVPGAEMHLGNVTVTGGSLDLPNATMKIDGDVMVDAGCLRVGQGPQVTTAVTQTAGCVSGRGSVNNQPSYLQFNGWSATSTYSLQGGELNLPVTFYMTGGTAALNISGGRLTSKVTTVNNPASVTVTLSETGVLATALPAGVNLKAQGGTVVGAADRTIAATAILTGGAQGVLLDASAAPVVFTAATLAEPAAALRVKVGTDTAARDLVRGIGSGLNDFTLEGNLPAGLKADWDAATKTLRLVKAAVIPPEYTSEAGNAVLALTKGVWPKSLTGTTAGSRPLSDQAISNALSVFDGIASGDAEAVTVHYEFGIRAMTFDVRANTLKLTIALTDGSAPARLTEGTVLRLYEGNKIMATLDTGLNDQGEAMMELPMHDGTFLPIKVEAYKETAAPAAL